MHRLIWLAAMVVGVAVARANAQTPSTRPTVDDGTWYLLKPAQMAAGAHHVRHAELFADVEGLNSFVLRGIDAVQATAPKGGGYFIGVKAKPAESPIGYPLKLFGNALIDPPRTTSYCSGSTYTAFIEAMNLLFPDGAGRLSAQRLEALRMQEPDGSRREDTVKFWGWWNDDGFGSHKALVQYSRMGVEILPRQLRPGDFLNISWNSGNGHSVIFLGWHKDEQGGRKLMYWSSQPATDGLADQLVDVARIKEVKCTRLTMPEHVFDFDVKQDVKRHLPGDKIEF